MIPETAALKSRPFPLVLKYTDVRSYILTLVFILCDVLVPWVFHQFHLAGPTFLPMHIFILLAGLMFGWRAGLIVGIMTPFVSYAVSGMPALPILPQTVVELSIYGLVAGVLREKLNLRVIWSLLGAMAAGRIALVLAASLAYLITGQSASFLGSEANPFLVAWTAIRQGWPGIIIQLLSIPAVIWLLERRSHTNKRDTVA
ncbi:MAG: ECF transporter S component [Chloroflexota bacterium]